MPMSPEYEFLYRIAIVQLIERGFISVSAYAVPTAIKTAAKHLIRGLAGTTVASFVDSGYKKEALWKFLTDTRQLHFWVASSNKINLLTYRASL